MDAAGVFSSGAPAEWSPRFAVIGARPGAVGVHGEEDGELAFAFAAGAALLAELWGEQDLDDSMILVVLYLLRHALELGLKRVVGTLARSLEFELREGQDPPVDLAKMNKDLAATHRLDVLARHLTRMAALFGFEVQGEVEAVCEMFAAVDPDGQWLRYSEVRVKTPGQGSVLAAARQAPVYVDVPQLLERAGTACAALDVLLGQVEELQDGQLWFGPDYAWREFAASLREESRAGRGDGPV
ncbi:hypothetical protein KDL01_10065 [Actinospica durhamensis]|uniref:Uncharacterized protein n=1 Tax=Actinospica durhamensis TaxID=1508375 RepID=A0A941ELN4_9ACTN|nr:hypothetical protein [Actinospica durhamensis]MBR7833611.1 hypothetical protein [Actinospica durhamensis]